MINVECDLRWAFATVLTTWLRTNSEHEVVLKTQGASLACVQGEIDAVPNISNVVRGQFG
jgi:hypothetical protein